MTGLHAAAYAQPSVEFTIVLGVVTALAIVVGSLAYGLCLGASKDRPTPEPRRTPTVDEHADYVLAIVNGDPDFEHAVLVDLAHIDELTDGTAGGGR